MKVAFWNVCNRSTPEDITAHCEAMQREGVEVFCLQEVPDEEPAHAAKVVANELGLELGFAHTRTFKLRPEGAKDYGTAILSSAGLTNVWRLGIPHERPLVWPQEELLRYGHQRTVIFANTEERPDVTIGVAHLSYRLPFFLGNQTLKAEMRALGNEIAFAQARQTPHMLFGGDLNCLPGGELDQALEAEGLELVSPADLPTYRSKHWYTGNIERNLDRVFASPGLVVASELGDYGPSDHRPVITEVK